MRGVVIRALLTAAVVGPILTAINQGPGVVAGQGLAIVPALLTLAVPFLVSFSGGMMMRRVMAEECGPKHAPDEGRVAACRIVSEIHGNAHRVNHASRERLAMLDTLNVTADGLRDVLADLSANATENRAQLDQTRGRVDEMAGSARALGERAGRDLALCRELGEALEGFSDAFRAIERLAAEIREIVTKTGLLATNAGIEAARSGDAGRGFKVVAVEVGALAARTGRCAVDIDQTLERLATRMTETHRQLGALSNSLDQTSAESRHGTEIASTMAVDIRSSIGISDEITRQMEGAIRSFGVIAEHIQHLRGDTEAAIRGSAQNIALAASALDSLVDRAPGHGPDRATGTDATPPLRGKTPAIGVHGVPTARPAANGPSGGGATPTPRPGALAPAPADVTRPAAGALRGARRSTAQPSAPAA